MVNVIAAVLTRKRTGEGVVVVVRCPFCGQVHEHAEFGRRIASCAMGVYVLVKDEVSYEVGTEVVGAFRDGRLRRGVIEQAPRRKGGLAIVRLEAIEA